MRAVFLDFDGVVHPVSAIADWRTLNVHGADIAHLIQKRDLFRWLPLLEQSMEDHPDVLLVVHSGWRAVAENPQMREILGPSLSERFIGVTSMNLNRFEGIVEFAQRSAMQHYLILDDATQEFPQGCQNLVSTDPEVGISDPSITSKLQQWLESTAPLEAGELTNSSVLPMRQ